jgi:hypothetical protein
MRSHKNKRYVLGDNKINIASVEAMKAIQTVEPKFANHMYHQNRIVEAFAMSVYGNIDVLEQPMCGKCEKPGWNTIDTSFVSTGDADKDREIKNCFCPECGSTTKNTLSVRQYLMQELGIQEDKICEIENKIEKGVDTKWN